MKWFKPLNIVVASIFILFTISSFHSDNNKNYKTLWQEVADLESKGLPKSALSIVNQIYSKATAENNAPQIIKAVI